MIIGIDPGLSGAIGVLDSSGKALMVLDMPLMIKGKGTGAVKQCINARGLYDLLKGLDDNATCVLETVNSRPGQGVAGVFSLGDTYGCIRSVIACLGMPLINVAPVTWKKHFKITKDKEVARALAIETFPEMSKQLARKKDIDRAESLLIALWGFKTNKGC